MIAPNIATLIAFLASQRFRPTISLPRAWQAINNPPLSQ
jgi:hypothetical protein